MMMLFGQATLFGLIASIAVTIILILMLGRPGVRWLVITISEFVSLFALVASAAAGAIMSYPVGAVLAASMVNGDQNDPRLVAVPLLVSLLGAILFFAAASVPMALIFLLSQIAVNTKFSRVKG